MTDPERDFSDEPTLTDPGKLSDKEQHVLAHSTAWPKCYRNHFCASEGHHDWETLQALCARGLMCVGRKPGPLSGGDTVFIVTVDGFAALETAQPRKRRRA